MSDLSIFASCLLLSVALTYLLAPLFEAPRPLPSSRASSSERKEALDRRKTMIYQSIHDADLDRQTGKLSDEDHDAMVRALKAEAASILRQLDRASAEGA